MPDIMAEFLGQFYGFDADTAREILAELRDRRSLEILARGYRTAPKAETPPQRF
jgi:hypothetical protein